ncbi:MAG: ferrous iron transport protein B [Ruminococcaceae bacterium]|nr:ferrous iron transport protein B [Oscillospiraceae bacterium]
MRNLTIALAGNPNVGKSTVFNALTGMKQHTGNWAGKTVSSARGRFRVSDADIELVDVPGCYSLTARSAEEEVARDYICFGDRDAVVIVCDATCLERNLVLVLQTLEVTGKAAVCVNLVDEAKKRGISVNCELLSKLLGVPVTAANARRKEGLSQLSATMVTVCESENKPKHIDYGCALESAVSAVIPDIRAVCPSVDARWLALRLFDSDRSMLDSIADSLGIGSADMNTLRSRACEALSRMELCSDSAVDAADIISAKLACEAERICSLCVAGTQESDLRDRRIDSVVTGKWFAFPIMFLLVALVFWLTIEGANYPSELLASLFSRLGAYLSSLLADCPAWLRGILIDGVYSVTTRVVSVMLPPMAIFFPLFTLLEDFGYLPRIAFNLDRCFKKCSACGKQALTMCMGLGCNAVGVTGCRIIDSPRERIIATVTNSFIPCNGRFPTLIAIITMFFAAQSSLLSALTLAGLIMLSVAVTLAVSKLLSKTLLKGQPSSFTLELPPYRMPQIGRTIVRSVFDRTLFVLGRALITAAPAGLIIWLLANITVGQTTVLSAITCALDPFASFFGLDGVILTAFILGLPANEIVLPIIIMAYGASGTLVDFESLSSLRELLCANGWTEVTAVCVMLFSLMHWPCATTLITIKKETGSFFWTVFSAIVPAVIGLILCFFVKTAASVF